MSVGKWFMLTVPEDAFSPENWDSMKETVVYMKGQKEQGGTTGYLHWQIIICTKKNMRVSYVKRLFGTQAHVELTRSAAAEAYVWKEDTRVQGTQFLFGIKPLNPAKKTDWEDVWKKAKDGILEEIPPHVLVRSYNALKAISKDHMKPTAMERTIMVYWGPTGSGKSRRAWEEATFEAYPKDPMTKFWDGYQGQDNVVMDEFRGDIAISHLLRWFDRYPVCVEAKHGGTVLKATRIWITSNLNPMYWYPQLDAATRDALMRRLTIINIV